MTGIFATAKRPSACVLLKCGAVIHVGEVAYLFKSLERQTVCLDCAKARWGYVPSETTPIVTRAAERQSLGFDSTRSILQSLQQRANRGDSKLRQAGGDQ
jgi:hypothetical protein